MKKTFKLELKFIEEGLPTFLSGCQPGVLAWRVVEIEAHAAFQAVALLDAEKAFIKDVVVVEVTEWVITK